MANMVVISGPIRNKLKFNCGTNAMGPYNRANAVVGRAFAMMSKTAGDLRNNVNAWETLGNTMQYNEPDLRRERRSVARRLGSSARRDGIQANG